MEPFNELHFKHFHLHHLLLLHLRHLLLLTNSPIKIRLRRLNLLPIILLLLQPCDLQILLDFPRLRHLIMEVLLFHLFLDFHLFFGLELRHFDLLLLGEEDGILDFVLLTAALFS